MKKILFILTFISLTFRTAGQPENILNFLDRLVEREDTIIDPFSLKKESITKGEESRQDSIYAFDWNTGTTDWILVSSSLHSYNLDHTHDYTIHRVQSAGSWLNYSAQYYTYDGRGNREKEVVQAWSEAQQEWLNYSQNLFSYNNYNNLTQYIYQKWNSTLEVWDNFTKYIYDYDGEQNWIYYDRQDWNPDSLRWEVKYRFLYIYENGLKTEMTRQNRNAIDSTWMNSVKEVYSYNASDHLTLVVQYVWQTGSSTWKESTKIIYTYDLDDQVIGQLYQVWKTDIWENTALYTYQYALPGKESEIIFFVWNVAVWDTTIRYLYEYDVLGNQTKETWQEWAVSKGLWVNDYKWEYYLSLFNDSLIAVITDSTNISCYGGSDGNATVTPFGGTPPYSYAWDDDAGSTDSTIYGLSANRYYRVTVTDSGMNSVKDSVILSEPPEIDTGPIHGETLVEENDMVLYWIDSDSASIYSWHVYGGEITDASDEDSILVTWLYPGEGRILVVETTPDGCQGDTVYLDVYVSSTDIYKNRPAGLQIYPNPAETHLTIQLDNGFAEAWNIELLDITGKIRKQYDAVKGSIYTLPVGELQGGIYLIRIRIKNGIIMEKVMIR